MRGFPTPLRVYIALTAGMTCALFLVLVSIWQPTPTHLNWGLVLSLGLLIGLAYRFPLKLSDRTEILVDTAAILAAALLLDPPTAMAITALAVGVSRSFARVPFLDVLFSASQTAVQAGGAGSVYYALLSLMAGVSQPFLGQALAVGVASVAMYLINNILVSIAVGLHTGKPPLTVLRGFLRAHVLEEIALYLLGVLMAINGGRSTWLLLLTALPGVFIYLSIQGNQERRRQAEQIEALKEFNENIVQTMEEGILIRDVEGRITFVNPRMEAMAGYGPDEMVGQHWSQLVPLSFVEDVEAALQEGGTAIGKVRRETVLIRRDGGETPVLVSMTPRFEDGRFQGLLCVFTDITEQKQMEMQLLQAEKLSAIGELVAGVAHELNNPLTTVVGFSQLLQTEEDTEQLKEDLEAIHQAAQRCARIVENLLTFARQRKPGKTLVDLNKVINETMGLKAHQLTLDNIELVLDLDPHLPQVYADPFQMQQVLLNLVNNAQYAMRQAHNGGRLTLRTRRHGDLVRLECIDNGPGVPPEIVHRIFDPFFTTKGHEGTGLGLSVSHGIIRAHAGRIYVADTPGGGATFVVELPIPKDLPLEQTEKASTSSERLMGKRILVVDDEEHILALVGRILRADNHRVDIATNGEEALEKLRTHTYDLLLIDLRMPGMDGKTLFERLAKERPSLLDRVVFVTGEVVSQENRSFVERTGRPLIRKPFTVEKLRTVLRKHLNGHNGAAS